MTEEHRLNFEKATKCWICEKDFIEGDKKVRGHCRYSGRFRGAPHNKCNNVIVCFENQSSSQ